MDPLPAIVLPSTPPPSLGERLAGTLYLLVVAGWIAVAWFFGGRTA